MSKLRILGKAEVESVLTMPMAIEAVEQAYLQKQRGQASVWPLLFHDFAEDPLTDMDLKSGNLDGDGVWGYKAISCYTGNRAKGLPVYHGLMNLWDRETGEPRAILNAGPITNYRTGAAAAVGAKYLARQHATRALVCGTGGLAPYIGAALICALPRLEAITYVNPRHPDAAAQELPRIAGDVRHLLTATGIDPVPALLASDDLEAGVGQADVVVTATPATQPYLRAEWVRPGTHLSCMGSDKSGKQEIEGACFSHARAICDDTVQVMNVGECEMAHKQGFLEKPDAEIGAVIAGEAEGRQSAGQITIFDSTGLALQDLASASRIVARAEKDGIGTVVDL